MEIIIHHSAEEVAARAADFVAAQLARKPDSVLGLATGSTPVATYAELIREGKDWLIDRLTADVPVGP